MAGMLYPRLRLSVPAVAVVKNEGVPSTNPKSLDFLIDGPLEGPPIFERCHFKKVLSAGRPCRLHILRKLALPRSSNSEDCCFVRGGSQNTSILVFRGLYQGPPILGNYPAPAVWQRFITALAGL